MISGLPTSTSKPSRRMISMRIASCSSPRPETRNVSGESVSSTRMPGLSLRSFMRRSRSCGEVTKRPSLPANGETLDENSIETVGSSMRMSGSATGFSRSADGLADVDRLDAGDGDDLAGACPRDLDALQPLVAVEHGDLGLLHGAVAMDHRDPVGLADARR